jgi:hypothetical protein
MYWKEFAVLFAAALFGGVAVMPYSLKLLKDAAHKRPSRPVRNVWVLALTQTALFSAIVVGVGLVAAHAIGLGAPYVEAALSGTQPAESFTSTLGAAALLGVGFGAYLLGGDLLFLPHLPQQLVKMAERMSLWDNFLASFYGGINEEFLMRLFGLSGLAWLLSRAIHTQQGLPTTATLWVANVAMALIFAAGHLPATKALVGRLTPVVLSRAFLLNVPIALICGWLFWTRGIEAAVIAHFSADIAYHVGGTALLRRIIVHER